jgi:peptidyl-prolyl cis-trans isomerase A (cyclophilin A)
MSFRVLFWVLFVGGMGMVAQVRAQIYADVTLAGGVTGTFRIQLEHTKAPVAVANFIGLATGQNGWIDPVTGRLRNDPYYNGLTFHRVIAGFVSQTGSRNGLGNDGPGYTFANEIDPSLSHATSYTVAMANSGGIFSNGSQFYITAVPRDQDEADGLLSLDEDYTIFGRVITGTGVCDALNAVPTNSSVPVTPVVISSVSISGTSLSGFNIQPLGLPRVTTAKPVMKINGGSYSLGFDHLPFSTYFGSYSSNLTSWSRFIVGTYFHNYAPSAGDIDVTSLAIGGRQFFQLPRVDYSVSYNPIRPTYLANKSFNFPGLSGTEQMQLSFNAAGNAGTYAYNYIGASTQTGNIIAVDYLQLSIGGQAYAPYLYVILETSSNPNNNELLVFDYLEYTTATAGNHSTYSGLVGHFPSLEYFSGSFSSSP